MKTSDQTKYLRIISQNYESHEKQSNKVCRTPEQANDKQQLCVMLHTGEDLRTEE